jgi:hypothetical protein
MIAFLATLERFAGLDTLSIAEDKNGPFDIQYWFDKPVDTWPKPN